MREFKSPQGQVGLFFAAAVGGVELGVEGTDPVTQFGVLGGEGAGVDLVEQAEVQQARLLLAEQLHLTLDAADALAGDLLLLGGPFPDAPGEPITHRVLLLHPGEQRQHLLVDVLLTQAHPRMARAIVERAAVVDVFLPGGLLDDLLAGDLPAAVGAADQPAGVEQVVALVLMLAHQRLHLGERGGIDDRHVYARMPVALVAQFADVAAIAKDVVDLAAGPRRLLWQIGDLLVCQALADHVQRASLVGVQLEDAADVLRGRLINLDDAAAVHSDVLVAIGRHADEQPRLGPAGQAFLHVDCLLLGGEARHRRQDTPLHSPRRRVLGRLADGNQRHPMDAFQLFQFDVIEQVPRGPVDLVDEQAVDLVGVGLGVHEHLLEDLALGRFAGRLGDAKELDDRAAFTLGVPLQGIFLHVQAEAFPLLLPAADAGQGQISL